MLLKLCKPHFHKGTLHYVFYKNSGNRQASGPDPLLFYIKKRKVAAVAPVPGDEQSDIVGFYLECKFGWHSLNFEYGFHKLDIKADRPIHSIVARSYCNITTPHGTN